MSARPLMIASVLGATIGVPYLASRSPSSTSSPATPPPALSGMPSAATSSPAPPLLSSSATTSPTQSPTPVPALTVGASSAPLGGVRYHAMEQVLRFDVTKEWVYQNWSRKSTGPTDVGLFSVRVPLVTGTQPSALAGALTYYFNSYNQVEHISFRGRTGDPKPLISFLMRSYQLQPASAPTGEQVYQVAGSDGIQSELRTRTEPVVRVNSPHSSFAVELELARPGSKRYLPPRGPVLQIPPAPPSSSPTSESASAAASGDWKSIGSSVVDKFRYATPQEEGQVLWKRWPN